MEYEEFFLRFRDDKDNPVERQRLRQRLQEDTEQFLAAGGNVTVLDKGEGLNKSVPITRLRLWELNG